MKAKRIVSTLACSTVLALALVGCGGSGGDSSGSAATDDSGSSAAATETDKTPSYSPSEFSLGDFDVEIGSATTEYDDWNEVDALVFTLEVTNNGESAAAFGDYLNIAESTQGGEEIYWAYEVVDAEKGWQYAAVGSYDELEPGATAEYTYGFLLNGYDDPVIISFDSYTSGVEGGAEVTFDVSGCESDGYKAAQAEAEKESADREEELAGAETTLTIAGAEVVLPDGWYFEYISDNHYSSRAHDVDDNYEVDFNRDSNFDDAGTWAEDRASKFSDVTVEERDGGYYVEIGETTWYLYLDTSEAPIEIMGYKLTYDEAADVLAGVTIS